VTDHYAISDEHALSIARSVVANLNWRESTSEPSQGYCETPLFSAQEMGCIIPADPRKSFDIRKVLSSIAASHVTMHCFDLSVVMVC